MVLDAYTSMRFGLYIVVNDVYTSMEFGSHVVSYEATSLMMPILVWNWFLCYYS